MVEREEIGFESGGERCAGWWWHPDGDPPYPCVVLAPGFGGVREARLDAYGRRFCQAGLAALVFDYRHFGASEGSPRQLLDIGRQLADWEAAVSYVRRRADVDDRRVALWGTSFSGGHVLVVAARDPRVAAVVSQIPYVDGLSTTRALIRSTGVGMVLRQATAGLLDVLRAVTGAPPYTVPLVAAPGSLAAMTTPDAEPGYLALVPPGSSWRNEVAARVFLRVPTYRPVTSASRVRCPLLVCVAEGDLVTPPRSARRAAARALRGELRSFPVGHFEIYLGEPFEEVVEAQSAFLCRHLLGSPGRDERDDRQRRTAG